MIKIHGLNKIADKLKTEMALLKVGQQVLIEWPGHFALMLHKLQEGQFDLQFRAARASEINALAELLEIQNWTDETVSQHSWIFR